MVVAFLVESRVVQRLGVFHIGRKAGQRGGVADLAASLDLDADPVCSGIDPFRWNSERLGAPQIGGLDRTRKAVVDQELDREVVARAFARL